MKLSQLLSGLEVLDSNVDMELDIQDVTGQTTPIDVAFDNESMDFNFSVEGEFENIRKVDFVEFDADKKIKIVSTLAGDKNFDKIKEVLEMMGTVDVEENFIGTRWSKLLINAAFSGMSAVLGCTFGEASKPRESRRVVQALIKECIDVCKAGGIRIEPVQGKDIVKLLDYNNSLKRAFSFFIIPIAIRKHAKLKASMLQDLEKGKLTEVDAINGAVSEYGRKVGCPTPMNDRVVEIIHSIEQGKLKAEFGNICYFN